MFPRICHPHQHLQASVFRAIENGVYLVRAANTGISGFIDSKGRILAQTDLFEAATLTVTIKTNEIRSFYTKYGDLFSYLCIILSIILLGNFFGMSRKKIRR